MTCDGTENSECNLNKQGCQTIDDSSLSLYSWAEMKLAASEIGSPRTTGSTDGLSLDLSSDIFKMVAPIASEHPSVLVEPLNLQFVFNVAAGDKCLGPQIIESESLLKKPVPASAPNSVCERLIEEYGAVFAAEDGVITPPDCTFDSAAEVREFNSSLDLRKTTIGGKSVELQAPALTALAEAEAEAKSEKLHITPADKKVASLRTYEATVELWKTRVDPALKYWQAHKRLDPESAEAIRSMPVKEQIEAVLKLEEEDIYFSKNFKKSILQSVAAPGSSQHLVGLAVDIQEHANPEVRSILNKHGWFQTVRSDLPHFTYLGLNESELPSRGLQLVESGQRRFWIRKPVEEKHE